MLKKNSDNIFVKVKNGKEVEIAKYLKTIKQSVDTNVLILETFADSNSTVPIERLKDSERKHFETLEIMENAFKPQINNYFNKFDRIEINVDCEL
jgi:hypothetical protein